MISILVVILTGIILAPLSCIMLWGRYVSFTDSLIHSCIFGGFISHLFGINIVLAMILSGVLLWVIATNSYRRQNNHQIVKSKIDINTLYLISMFMSSIAISLGVNYNQLLFGNLLFVTYENLFQLITIAVIIYSFLWKYRRDIYLMSLDIDLAAGLGVKVQFLQKCCLLLIITTVSIVIKVLGGGFFIVGAMILPSIIAVNISKNPSQMLIYSVIISTTNNIFSIVVSEKLDLDFAPLTIICGFILYSGIIGMKNFFLKIK